MTPKLTLSQILIVVAVLFTGLASFDSSIYQYGMNSFFLDKWEYHVYLVQIFSSQFLHGDFLHLIMNALFIIIFWTVVESILWDKKYLLFFMFSSIFIALWITFLSQGNTVWMSGFAMAIIAYYTLHLKQIHNPDYKWWITALIINIGIWFMPWISLIWHLFWAIAGGIYFFLLNVIKK